MIRYPQVNPPPHGRVIMVPFKKCLFQFPVSTVYDFFFRGHFRIFLKSEFASYKNEYNYCYIISIIHLLVIQFLVKHTVLAIFSKS